MSNVIKLVRKGGRQRDSVVQKRANRIKWGKIDSKTRQRGLRLKKECEKGFSVRRRSRRKCGCP